jgi:hypothetical protein
LLRIFNALTVRLLCFGFDAVSLVACRLVVTGGTDVPSDNFNCWRLFDRAETETAGGLHGPGRSKSLFIEDANEGGWEGFIERVK